MLMSPATEGTAGGFIATLGASDSQTPAGTTGLAAPLPHTTLGSGISEGATDPSVVGGGSTHDSADSSVARTAPPANDRTDSLASVTAIRHGHAGARDAPGPSPLAAEALDSSEPSDTGVSAPASSTAVGSPATNHNEPIAPSTKPSESAIADSPTTKAKDLPTTTNTSKTTNGGVPPSPVSKSGAASDDKGHRRASSTSSTGKKKAGFMNKLKGEMKVISGKIGGDEAKVQAGEKLKHGGEPLFLSCFTFSRGSTRLTTIRRINISKESAIGREVSSDRGAKGQKEDCSVDYCFCIDSALNECLQYASRTSQCRGGIHAGYRLQRDLRTGFLLCFDAQPTRSTMPTPGCSCELQLHYRSI